MAKLYSKNVKKSENFKPEEETVRFLLSYSKALNITRSDKFEFEAFLN